MLEVFSTLLTVVRLLLGMNELLRVLTLENDSPHLSQECGFSPV